MVIIGETRQFYYDRPSDKYEKKIQSFYTYFILNSTNYLVSIMII